ncbi:MAG: hypothetical protein AB1491_12690 [Thermodesulfobacteriota bacterium]
MSEEGIISRYPLANGLVLEFRDRSRPMAGDRRQVVLEARVAIPLNAATLPPELLPHLAEITAALGTEAIFTKQEVRHFIPETEAAKLLQEMAAGLLKSLQDYLSHPDFASRFIRKKVAEYQEKRGRYS